MSRVTVMVPQVQIVNPCPFCGTDAADLGGGSDSPYFVKCSTCLATGPRVQVAAGAISAWNDALHAQQRQVIELQATVLDLNTKLAPSLIGLAVVPPV